MKVKSQKSKLFLVPLCFLIFTLFGCAKAKEAVRGIAGVSTKVLEDNRDTALKKTFNYDCNTAYNKAKEILEKIDTYIYAEDATKKMIAVYLSEEDTTPVGIFFKEIDAANTEIQVSSPSSYAKELISGKLFSALGEPIKPEEKKGQPDANKETADK